MNLGSVSVVLAVVALAISAFSAGYSMANWHFSSTFVRDKIVKELEKELRWRLQLNKETSNEISESTKDEMAK